MKIIGCLQGFWMRSLSKYVEQALKTTLWHFICRFSHASVTSTKFSVESNFGNTV